jgi:hypothetical protein
METQQIESTKPVKQPRKRQSKKPVEESTEPITVPPEKKPRKRHVKKTETVEPIADLPIEETKSKSKPKTEKKPRKSTTSKKPIEIKETEPELTIESSVTSITDEPVVITEPSILKTHRFNYIEKLDFIKGFMSVLSKQNVISADQLSKVTSFIESNEIEEIKSNSDIKFDNEMEEYVITTIKYKHTDEQIYLKDENGNLYTVDSPHSFVLNLYDSP